MFLRCFNVSLKVSEYTRFHALLTLPLRYKLVRVLSSYILFIRNLNMIYICILMSLLHFEKQLVLQPSYINNQPTPRG